VRIEKAIIPAAGLGTRLLPATKEQPKEMLPVFAKSVNGVRCMKPLVQLIFEQLYDSGIRDFCIVIGRGKRAIEDHFTQDYGFVTQLTKKKKMDSAKELEAFYSRVDHSSINWITQPQPKGFGDAVLCAAPWVGEHAFLVHAGDAYILSKNNRHLTRLLSTFHQREATAGFLVKRTVHPSGKGVITPSQVAKGIYRVKAAVEKPRKFISNLAIEPVYAFEPTIFNSLRSTRRGVGGELQLTDAIQQLIDKKNEVLAVELRKSETRLDIGDPESYEEALRLSFKTTASEVSVHRYRGN